MNKLTEMLSKLVAMLWGKPAQEVVQATRKVTRDSRISEPVWMMLESMRTKPQNWRVEIIFPPFDPLIGKFLGQRMTRVRGIDNILVSVKVTDRSVGEVYNASVWVDEYSLYSALGWRRTNVLNEYNMVFSNGIMSYPEWLNHIEARDLYYTLVGVMQARLKKIQAYQMREETRAREAAILAKEKENAAERDRLIKVYGGK